MKGVNPAKQSPVKEEGNEFLTSWASAFNTFEGGLAFVNSKLKEGQESVAQLTPKYAGGVQPNGIAKTKISKAAPDQKPKRAVQHTVDTEILQQFRAYRALVHEDRRTMKDIQTAPCKQKHSVKYMQETRQEEDTTRDATVNSTEFSASKQESYDEIEDFVLDPLDAKESRTEATISLQKPEIYDVDAPTNADVIKPAFDIANIDFWCDEKRCNAAEPGTAAKTDECSKEPVPQGSSDVPDSQLEQYHDSPQTQDQHNEQPTKFDHLGDKSPLMREIESLPSFHTMAGIATLTSPIPTSSAEPKGKDTPIVVVRDVVNESDIISILEEPHSFNMFNFSQAFTSGQPKSSDDKQNSEERKAFSIWKEFLLASDAMKQCGVQIEVPRNGSCFQRAWDDRDDNSSLGGEEQAGDTGKAELFSDIAQFWTNLMESEQKESFLVRAKEAWDREFTENTKMASNLPKPDLGEKSLLHLFGLDDEQTVVSASSHVRSGASTNRQGKGHTRHRSRSREGRSQMRTAVLGSRDRSTSRGSVQSSSSRSRSLSVGRARRGLSSHPYTGRDESGRREAPDFIDITVGRDPDWTISKRPIKTKHKHMTRRESHKQGRRRKGVERSVSVDSESVSTREHHREVSKIGRDVFSMAEKTLDKRSGSRQSRSRSQSRHTSSQRERARSSSNRPSHRRSTSRPRVGIE